METVRQSRNPGTFQGSNYVCAAQKDAGIFWLLHFFFRQDSNYWSNGPIRTLSSSCCSRVIAFIVSSCRKCYALFPSRFTHACHKHTMALSLFACRWLHNFTAT